jgi:tricorn protease-like protein
MLDALRTRVLAEPWLQLLVLALGSYFVFVHRPRAAAAKQKALAANQKAVAEKATAIVISEKEAAEHKADKARREAIEWRSTRYRRWLEERQHAACNEYSPEPGLRPALLRLALASLLQPRLAADAWVGTMDLPGDVVGVVGNAVESALQFCGVLAGHTDFVLSAAFSPEGQKIVSASADKTVRVWSAATGDCEQTMTGHTSTVTSAAFSPDGLKIVSASYDRTVRVWDVASGNCEQTMTGHTGMVLSAAFSPDGLKIVSASYDKTVRVWGAASGNCEHTMAGHTSSVTSAAFSPEGQQIVSASCDKTVRVWDAMTGENQQTLTGHTHYVNSARFSPDGLKVVSASGQYRGDDNTVRIWSAVTGECERTMHGHSSAVESAVFSPEGRQLVSASHDETVRVWDVATGDCQQLMKGHTTRRCFATSAMPAAVFSATFSPDGLRIVSASEDMKVRVWHAATGDMATASRRWRSTPTR